MSFYSGKAAWMLAERPPGRGRWVRLDARFKSIQTGESTWRDNCGWAVVVCRSALADYQKADAPPFLGGARIPDRLRITAT
jgi:hypothetical protein